ncbi:MAG: hypothetical protein H6573_10410 [Lewinellaceae bacterium]|nr:hypothetical protein [Lewinellaceae bacterium]
MPKNLILTTLLCLSITLAGQTPIFHLNFDEEAGETTTEQVSGSVLSIRNTFNRPERISANFGNALRLDGYSTYIADLNYFIQNYTDKLTIEYLVCYRGFHQRACCHHTKPIQFRRL